MAENKKLVPKRRFKGFAGEWEVKKLSNICSMHARIGWQNLRTSEFLDSGNYYLITGTDFNDGKINLGTCHYVEKDRYDQDRKIQIKNGSILITKDGTLGKVAFVEDLDKPATLNAGVFNVEIIDENVDNKYLFQYIKAPFLMNYVDKKSTGGTIKHLNQNILVDFPVVLPTLSEQTQIGTFFAHLDNLITHHQRKLEKTKALKSAYLSEMFPQEGESVPKRRFKGFTGEWERRKLGEVAKYSASPLTADDIDCLGKHKLYDANRVIGFTNKNIQNRDYITIIKDGAGVGRVRKLPKNTAFIGTMGAISPNECCYNFLYCLLEKTDFKSYISGGTIPHIYFSQYGQKNYFIPMQAEQTQIGTFFAHLDNLITHHQRKLQKLQDIKKAYLNEMFI